MEISQKGKRRLVILSLLSLAFLFRLGFGLCSELWFEDEKQIYLIGLKFYSTGGWPYFGPDVTSTIQIPGALQGLMVGLPFYVLPIPEAPYILLNVISFAALCFFAWYCTQRLPDTPKWIVWTWLLTAPWTLNLSTHFLGQSYVLPGAIFFFVGALETYPGLKRDLIPTRWANLMMGLALCWVMQFHMSWVILVPYVLVSLYFQYREQGRGIFSSLAWLAGGAALTGSLIVPTYLKFGFAGDGGGTASVLQFNRENILSQWNVAEGILGRFLSLASYEVPRFLGANTHSRLLFMKNNPWLIPFILFVGIVGLAQPIVLLILWFRKNHSQRDWEAVKYLTLATVCLLYVSFAFSFRAPQSNTLIVIFPIAMLYSLYCWSEYLRRPRWQKFAAVFLICGIVFSAGLAYDNYQRKSLYIDRETPKAAIETRNYHLLGERREGARY